MIKHDLTPENYFSKKATMEYWGSTSFKSFDMQNEGTEIFGNLIEGGCEAREMAVLNGTYEKEDKKAFLIGHYVHSWSEGPEAFRKFIQDNYKSIYTNKDTLRSDFQKADLMVKALREDPIVSDIRNCEKEFIMVGDIAGQKFKIMVDLLDLERGYFADIKTTDKINKTVYKNGKKMSFIDVFDYKLQAAIYAEIVRQNTGRELDFYIIVVDKKPMPDHEVIYMGNPKDDQFNFFAKKLHEVAIKIDHMQQVKTGLVEPKRCGKCKYCLSTKKINGPIALDEFERNIGIRDEA